jgi:S-DNA-T family DNA segregation ATPase FtsK/SpoIIIE
MFDENLPPGGGYWLGHRVQVALAKPTKQLASEPRCREVDGTAALAGVSRNPRQFARRVRVAFPLMSVIELAELRTDPAPLLIGDGSSCIIGEPEAWLAQWGALPALRSHSALMFDGCTIADVRAISASRELPPPPSRGERPLWMLGRDGSFERARLPVPAVS